MRRILLYCEPFSWHSLVRLLTFNYPYGFNITWPPLFDQISAALCLALGQQDHETIAVFVPVIIGSIAVAVVYYLVKELFGREVALLSAFMTVLAPYYLLYTMLGAMDHHCLEVLMHLISLLFVVLAITRSNKKYHFTVLAGIAMAALAYTWQGADVYLGIFLVYAAVKMTLDLKSGSYFKGYHHNASGCLLYSLDPGSSFLEHTLDVSILHRLGCHDLCPVYHVCPIADRRRKECFHGRHFCWGLCFWALSL